MGESDNDERYKYLPSLAAAAIFTALFFITTLLHLWQTMRRRTWYFIPFIIGGVFEIAGYIGRIIGSKESPNYTLGPYIIQALLLLLAPALFAASIYMILSRLIRMTQGESLCLVRVTWLTKIFVLGDVLSFLMQALGAGVLSSADNRDQKDKGELIITIGLIVQILFFGLFIITSLHYHFRLRKDPTEASHRSPVSWQGYLCVLYVASVFIMIRSIFRVIEYVQGEDGALLSKEVYLYIFDALLMLATMVIFNLKHPSTILPSNPKTTDQDSENASGDYVMQETRGRG